MSGTPLFFLSLSFSPEVCKECQITIYLLLHIEGRKPLACNWQPDGCLAEMEMGVNWGLTGDAGVDRGRTIQPQAFVNTPHAVPHARGSCAAYLVLCRSSRILELGGVSMSKNRSVPVREEGRKGGAELRVRRELKSSHSDSAQDTSGEIT